MLSFETQIKRARIVLERRGKTPSEFLNPEIHESWNHCIALGLDPLGQPEHVVIDRDDLEEIRAKDETLICSIRMREIL